MRNVVKGNAPECFAAWKAGVNEDWTPTYANLRNPEKVALHEALLVEQGSTCCYCGRRIEVANSHIEHFIPQEQRTDLALDYDNLHASCIRERPPGISLHCGHAKDRNLDSDLSISPIEKDCEMRFMFTLDGQILATGETDPNANYMIDLLKLQTPSLRNARRAALAGIFDQDFLESVTGEELEALCRFYRSRSADGRLPEFAHVIARFADRLAES